MNAFQRFAARLFFGSSSVFENANNSPRRARVPGAAPRDACKDMPTPVRSELVRRSRYLVKNSGFLREIVSSMALYAVGDGIRPQAQSDDAEFNKRAEELFASWARKPEVTGRFNLTQCLRLICRAIDVDGEIFVLKTAQSGRPKIQLIETHRVASEERENVIDGIRINAQGRPTAYGIVTDSGATSFINAQQVIHVFEPESPSQLRGIPSLQHSINHLLDENELLALEKHAVKSNADITRVLTTDDADADTGFALNPSETGTDAAAVQAIVGGKVVRLNVGETLTPFESQRPSPTFTGFLDHLNRDCALGLLPYEFAADSSKIGGAGVRLIVGKADRRFSARQDTLIEQFLTPIWYYIIGTAIDNGELPAVKNWHRVAFVTPRRVTVDAGREAQQNREDIKAGLKTLSDHFAELGADFKEELRNRAEEMAAIRDVAAEYGLDPRDLYASFVQQNQLTNDQPL